jgi:hypothetical protein
MKFLIALLMLFSFTAHLLKRFTVYDAQGLNP